MTDRRAYGRARALGAVREAEQLGSPVVGTEHLLAATLADPVVRWAFRTVGVDRRQVRDEVVKATGRRRRRNPVAGITADAAEAIMQAGADSDLLDEDEPDGADVGRVLQEIVRRFLARTKQSEARDVLDHLGLIQHRARVLATIEHNAAPARLPPTTARRGHRDASPSGTHTV